MAQLSGYSFRKKLTIDYTQVSGSSDLTDFPLLIGVTDTDLMTILNGGDVTSDNGYDVVFTAVDGTTQLDHDLQSFDGTTGDYAAFVRIPTLSATVNTEIYMYYGNADVTTDQSSTGTWDSNYVGVWHLEESGSGAADEYADMSGYGNHGQGGDGTASRVPTQTTGKIGNAQSYDATDDQINCGSDASLDNLPTFTFTAWVNVNDATGSGRLFEKRATSAEAKNLYVQSNEQIRYVHQSDLGAGNELAERSSALTIGTWQHVAMTWSGDLLRTSTNIYINGVLSNINGGDGTGSPLDDSGGDFWIGNRHDANRPFEGLLDEMHISNTVRSLDWITTEYTNQDNPASFIASTGAEEPTSFPGNVSAGLMIWLRANSGVLNSPDVTAWADQTGVSNAVAVAAGDPQLVEDAINFNPAMELNGSTDYFETITNSIIGGSNPYTKFAVAISDNTSVSSQLISSDGAGNLEMRHDASGNLLATHAATDLFSGGGTFTQGTPSIAVIRYGAGGLDNIGRLDGVSLVDNTTAAFADAGAFQIGAFNGGGFWDGKIGEVILVDSELSDADIIKIESYLAIKYGITLDNTAGDYIASDGSTVIWDATGYSAYHNDIAGIGRDDDSGLDQRKSMSSNTDAMVIMDHGTSFSTDLDFLVWGNDDGDIALTTTDKHPSYDKRLIREWRVATNGTPGTVNVQMVFPGVADALLSYALHVDADGTFAAGTTDYATSSISGDTLTFLNVSFSDGDYFTLGITQRSPGAVKDNLALWFKADAGVNGSPITDWQDQSGNGKDATQAGTNNFPTLTASYHNYNPSVFFTNGGDGYFDVDLDQIRGTSYNLIAVLERTTSDGFNYLLGTTSTIFNNGLHFGYVNNTTARFSQFLNQVELTVPAFDNPATSLAVLRGELDTGSGKTVYELRDGAVLSNTDATTSTLGGNSPGVLGRGNGSSGFVGYASEVIAYNSTLTSTEVQQIYTYLAIKYGFTLENTTNYLASDGSTVLWDATTYSTYYNDVAGIGRDDASGLDQQKSMSTNADAMVIMDKGGSFGSDQDFILWGNDDRDALLTTTDKHPSYDKRLVREWRVAVNGTPGTVNVSVVYPGVSDAITDYVLHVDADGTFAGGTTDYTSPSISGDTVTFTNVSFSDGDFFTLGFNHRAPGDVKNELSLWLKANVGTSTTTDNTSLNEWSDQSGNGNTASTESVSREPTFKDNATDNVNYNPVLSFDDVDDRMMIDLDVLKDGGNYSLFVVGQRGNSASNYAIGSTNNSTDNQALHFGYQNSTTAFLGQWFNDLSVTVPAIGSPDSPYLLYGGMNSSGHFVREVRDGTTTEDSNTNTVGLSGNTQDWIGYFFSGSNLYYNGLIMEVIAYGSELTATEEQKVNAYLAIKYGLALDTDYLASDGTVIWEAAASTGYSNDITVIGRDDLSALSQKQSTTPDDSLLVYVGTLASNNAANAGTITNDLSFVVIGHNGERQMAHVPTEMPSGIRTRFNREWKITNTNFADDFSMEIEWEEVGTFDINDIRLLVDDDGDFSNATVYAHGDAGLSITSGSIIVGGISTSHIPANSTRYVTIGSVSLSTSLPIDLIDFEASADQEARLVNLNWSTAAEADNDYFSVQKSVDAREWRDVVVVPGAGHSSVRLDYQAVDDNPYPGLSYYRLKQTDFDGDFSYSNSIHVTLGAFEDELTLYPNPTQNILVIKGHPGDLIQLRIIDVQGKDVSNSVRVVSKNEQMLTVDISQLPVGAYSLVTGSQSVKLIKSP